MSCGQCYKTFFVRDLRILVVGLSVCRWQAFQACSDKHSSLLRKIVNYGQKKFVTLVPDLTKHFLPRCTYSLWQAK